MLVASPRCLRSAVGSGGSPRATRRRACRLARVARALGDPQLLVDADDEVADDLIDHAQAAIDLLHQRRPSR